MGKVLDYKCPACDAALKFNPHGQNWKCEYCRNEYSLEEKAIGTWIDGKKLYRKVIREEITESGIKEYYLRQTYNKVEHRQEIFLLVPPILLFLHLCPSIKLYQHQV